MRNSLLKKLVLVCLLFCAIPILWSCRSQKKPKLQAEVKILNESVYLWNRSDQLWTGGVVFLNDKSLDIQRPFGSVTPNGFAQLPLREFKYNSEPIEVDSFELEFVWVEAEGYAPEKFNME